MPHPAIQDSVVASDDVVELTAELAADLLRLLYENDARCRVQSAPDTTWELPMAQRPIAKLA